MFGGALALEYSFHLGERFLIRPFAGGQLQAVNGTAFQLPYYHTLPADTNVMWYPADSGNIRFKPAHVSFLTIGLPLAFELRRWEISTGIHASYRIGIKGTRQEENLKRIFTADPTRDTPPFRKNELPGRWTLGWQLGVDYELSARWRAGAQFNARLLQSGSAIKYLEQPPSRSGREQYFLHLRYYFEKK